MNIIMHIDEYKDICNMTYSEYCDYLQAKYGIGKADYMTKSFNKNSKCSRTNEGLVAHHKAEDKMIMLSTKQIAQQYPFEWQRRENIVYCDYLEHLFLHVLICMYPSPAKNPHVSVGIGGVINFISPELNDLYSGYQTKQNWRKRCYDLVLDDKDVYIAILKKLICFEKMNNPNFDIEDLCKSNGSQYGFWDESNNAAIYNEIKRINNNIHII